MLYSESPRLEGIDMYLRLVQAKLKPDLIAEVKYHYEKDIMPALQKVGGCLYAGLVQNTHNKDEGISLTLWESQEAATAYEQSGEYAKLLEVLRPYFSDMAEWNLALSEDLRIEYSPVSSEPEVRSYVSALDSDPALPKGTGYENLYLRVVSINVQKGKVEEFRSLYNQSVLPVLRNYPGCLVVQLAQSIAHAEEFISVTIWNTKEAAQNYEQSGPFEELKQILKPALAGLSQWSMDMESGGRLVAATDQDLAVETFKIVTGKVLT
jgi:heme-degrading monooxygenase HmoA